MWTRSVSSHDLLEIGVAVGLGRLDLFAHRVDLLAQDGHRFVDRLHGGHRVADLLLQVGDLLLVVGPHLLEILVLLLELGRDLFVAGLLDLLFLFDVFLLLRQVGVFGAGGLQLDPPRFRVSAIQFLCVAWTARAKAAKTTLIKKIRTVKILPTRFIGDLSSLVNAAGDPS